MSEEIKFEPVFGDQSLFEDAPDDAIAIRVNDYKLITYYFLTEEHLALTNSRELKAIPIIAMRRIIKVPTWTKVDQLAGRLPEVGSKYLGKNELNPEAELICDLIDGDECVWGHDKNKKNVLLLCI